jgi:hypothetical protein
MGRMTVVGQTEKYNNSEDMSASSLIAVTSGDLLRPKLITGHIMQFIVRGLHALLGELGPRRFELPCVYKRDWRSIEVS